MPSNNQDRPANPAAFAGLYRGGYPRLAPIDSARRKVWPFFYCALAASCEDSIGCMHGSSEPDLRNWKSPP
ncbi:hypothetical protein EJA41_16745, partial [Bordetella pertussis]